MGSKLRAGLVSHRWAYLQKFCWRDSNTITREDVLPLSFLRAEIIVVIDLTIGRYVANGWLDSLIKLCTETLRHLNLSGLKPYFINPFCSITKRIFNLVMQIPANQLQTLDLSGIGLNHSQLMALADRFPGLIHARSIKPFLTFCPRVMRSTVGSDALEQIQIQCPELKELEIDEMRSFSANAWNGLVANLTCLEKLVIGGKCSGKIRSIGRLGALTYLEINVGASLTDSLIRSIGISCPKLKGLHLTDPYGMSRLSDKSGLRHLARLTNLERLALNEVHFLSDSSLRLIADSNPNLKSLSLAICINITDNSLVHLLIKCKQLKALDISGLQLATTKTLVQVQRNVNIIEKALLPARKKDSTPLFQLWRRNCKELWENTNPWLSIYQ
uniref:Uncharacterized protein n=1 Tax=Ditylenchus dipsaci TaxID=166011 RepID=A0A915DP96_9BILA